MNEQFLSHLAHAGLSLATQLVIGLTAFFLGVSLFDSSVMGGLFAIGFYWGREVAQVERHAGTPPWWSGFNPRNWKADNWGDFLFPLVACVAAVLAVRFAVG